MLNSCSFIGHLGADPESKSFQNGGKVCNLRLAVTEKWKKDGQKQEKTEWISVAIFSEGLVGVAERFLRKGSKVYITGKIATRKWQDQNGNDRFTTEIILQGPQAQLVMLDGPSEGNQQSQRSQGRQSRQDDGWGSTGSQSGGDLDDDIPF